MAKEAVDKIKACESCARKILEEAEKNAVKAIADAKASAEKKYSEIISAAKQKSSDDIKRAELDAEEYKSNYMKTNQDKNNEPLRVALQKKEQAKKGVINLLF